MSELAWILVWAVAVYGAMLIWTWWTRKTRDHSKQLLADEYRRGHYDGRTGRDPNIS